MMRKKMDNSPLTLANRSASIDSGTKALSGQGIIIPNIIQLFNNVTIRKYVRFGILLIACFAAYYPILFNDFLYRWDDQWVAINEYTEGGINFNNIWAIFSQFYHGQYAPVNECLYLFVYTLFGYNPIAFHFASLMLHILNVCLAYIIIKRIIKQSKRVKIENASTIAFISALLWAIHPINVESVAWVSASKILIYAFFYLAATLTYLLFLDKMKVRFYFLTIVFFALSFFSKEQAVVFPFWMLLLYWIVGGSIKESNIWTQVAPFIILAFVGGIVTMLSQKAVGGGVLSQEVFYPLWQRLILGCYSFIEYIVKFVLPINLMYIYPFPMVVGEALPTWMLLYPIIIFLILVTLWNLIKKIPLSIGFIFFLIHIAIVLHIIPLSRFAVVADRYVYVACIGLSFIVSCYFVRFLTQRKSVVRRIASGFFVSIILIFGVYSNNRCRDWKDTDSIKKEMRDLLHQREDYVQPVLEERKGEEKKESSIMDVDVRLDATENKYDKQEKIGNNPI